MIFGRQIELKVESPDGISKTFKSGHETENDFDIEFSVEFGKRPYALIQRVQCLNILSFYHCNKTTYDSLNGIFMFFRIPQRIKVISIIFK
ncbi:MAG: hypothetical protein SFU98_02320 [Leptospiraceae bacterium]|nr:hypothetical protein [Leptospiraceae bacterium]